MLSDSVLEESAGISKGSLETVSNQRVEVYQGIFTSWTSHPHAAFDIDVEDHWRTSCHDLSFSANGCKLLLRLPSSDLASIPSISKVLCLLLVSTVSVYSH